MKALVVYESMFGNTQSVARSISRRLVRHLRVQMASVDDAPSPAREAFDLVVVGESTHAFSRSRPLTRKDAVTKEATGSGPGTGLGEWLADFPQASDGRLVARLDTRIEKVRHLPGSAARNATEVADQLSYRAAAPPKSFYMADTTGLLVDGESGRAEAMGGTTWFGGEFPPPGR